MAKIPRRQYITEKMDTSQSNAGNDLKLAGQAVKGVVATVDHAVKRAVPFAAAVRGTENDNAAADFIRDITGINNKFAVNDMMGNAKIEATKTNNELQKKYADNPTDPNFQKELDQAIGQIFDSQSGNVPLTSSLEWQTARENTMKQFKESNMKWAEQQSVNNLNRRVKKLNEDANKRANFYGESDNLDEFLADDARSRAVLENLAADFRMSPEQTSAMLAAFDTQQMYNYLKGLATKDPQKVEQILKNNDAISLMLGEKGRADLRRAFKNAKTATGEDMQKIKDLDLAIPRSWGQDRIDALNKRTDELIAKGHSITAARKAAIQEFKDDDKEYQATLKAALDMPKNWGQTTREACASYAHQLMQMGLDAPEAYKRAIAEFKDKESDIRDQYEAELRDIENKGGRPSERAEELRAARDAFEAKGPDEVDITNMDDQGIEDLAIADVIKTLDRDLRQHIKKGKEIQNLENKAAARQAMYDEFDAFTANPSEPYIQARKSKPEYYLDNDYKKMTDAMEKWYKANLVASKVTETEPNKLPKILDALLSTKMQGTEEQAAILRDAYDKMSQIQGDKEIAEQDKVDYARLVKRFTKDPEYQEIVRTVYQSAGVDELYKEISSGYLKDVGRSKVFNTDRTGISSDGKIDVSKMSETQRRIYKAVRDADTKARSYFAWDREDLATEVLNNLRYNIMTIRYGNVMDLSILNQIAPALAEGKQVKFSIQGRNFVATGVNKNGTLNVTERITQ